MHILGGFTLSVISFPASSSAHLSLSPGRAVRLSFTWINSHPLCAETGHGPGCYLAASKALWPAFEVSHFSPLHLWPLQLTSLLWKRLHWWVALIHLPSMTTFAGRFYHPQVRKLSPRQLSNLPKSQRLSSWGRESMCPNPMVPMPAFREGNQHSWGQVLC